MLPLRNSFALACSLPALSPAGTRAFEPALRAATRPNLAPTVGRAVRFLETDMRAWRRDYGCAARHHGPMYLWAVGAAANAGFDVDRRMFRETTTWLMTDDEAGVLPRRSDPPRSAPRPDATDKPVPGCCPTDGDPRDRPRFVQATLYLAHALRELPRDDPDAAAARRRILEHWTATQEKDGLWAGRVGWPPIFAPSPVLATYAVSAVPHDSDVPDASRRTITRAAAQLRSLGPGDNHQALVLHLLLRTWDVSCARAAGTRRRAVPRRAGPGTTR